MTDAFSTEIPELLQSHLDMLTKGSGLSLAAIRERGYRSVLGKAELRVHHFLPRQCRTPGLLLPVCPPDGSNGLYCYRPDNPRQTADGKVLKYELPAGCSVRLDVPPRCRPALADPTIPLWLTEGQKKADALASRGLCAVALLGVWNFLGRDETGSVKLLADFDYIAWRGRTVNIVFDSDVMVKPAVRKALDRLTEHLQRKGATVNAVYLPNLPDGSKCGVDDYLLTHSVAELQALVEQPRPAPKAAAPAVELLDTPPPALTRPLQLIDGHAYATTWLWTRTTVRETLDPKTGDIVRHDPPIVRTERRQFVVRDDGVIFGDGGDRPIEELGLEVAIPSAPRDTKLWGTSGVKAYRAGYRPDPRDVLSRLVAVVDRFMSFDRSLAEQKTMCELVACYALSTWFLDALDVTGFLWPNGPSGSGKTKLGVLTCEVAYLGEVLLSGSTYASLRDLADLGATLLFDDAEGLADPKRTDPDKRNLLLAGNRKGTVVAVKEPLPNGTWGTRYVNAYCPRLFTAIRLPDPVLASRTIVIPLVRTADPRKANAEVLDYSLWPCDRRKLLDDLWALALANLAAMPAHVAAVNADAPLVGRNLEPWKGILAVAHWLEAEGEVGLYGRMCQLAQDYQTERVDLETPDLTRLVVRALCEVVQFVQKVQFVQFPKGGVPIEFHVSDVVTKVNEIAIDEDLADGNSPEYTNAKRVARILMGLRLRDRTGLRKATRTAKGVRYQVTLDELGELVKAYGLSAQFAVNLPTPPPETTQTTETAQTALPQPTAVPSGNGATRGDDEAARLLALAKAAGWPSVPLRPGISVAPGEECWHRFARAASAEDIRAALVALRRAEVAV
jgi:hypothetical protein